MALENGRPWEDEDRFCSSPSHSDDSPILSYRYDRRDRYESLRQYEDDRERRSTLTALAKFFLFCTAMILFCVLMYIPVYNKANYHMPKGIVAGWSVHTNRDTKIYVQPNNVTTIHEPTNICQKTDKINNNKLFLLIIVCSSTINFERRTAIRDTWGRYDDYTKITTIFNLVREAYKNYNYTHDLYPKVTDLSISSVNSSVNLSDNVVRHKRDLTISQLLPEIAKALQSNLVNAKTDIVPDEKRFDDDNDEIVQDFDMNKELGEAADDYDYNYDSNVMKIPPRGYEDSPDLEKVLNLLKQSKNFPEIRDNFVESANVERDFKLVFLLGLPAKRNDTETQSKIEEEVLKYGDIIQEGFVDSYNNLTLKSIMMLKWVTNNCMENVRYILKTDDDMYIHVPNLILDLRNRSKMFDEKAKGRKSKEYLLIGDLIAGAKPVLDSRDKWYSPRYMYGGRVYPRYLSGTGYALSAPAAHALYSAALKTPYFHLEDIYITGMCSHRATPRIPPRDDPLFSYRASHAAAPASASCWAHGHATAHRVPPAAMRALHRRLLRARDVDRCERLRLTQVRKDRMKAPLKKKIKVGLSLT